jgi:hypothetical protein
MSKPINWFDEAKKIAANAYEDRQIAAKEIGELRLQLRNAWAKLGCRCLFNAANEKVAEDPHCPYHGWYQNDADAWDPLGALAAGRS